MEKRVKLVCFFGILAWGGAAFALAKTPFVDVDEAMMNDTFTILKLIAVVLMAFNILINIVVLCMKPENLYTRSWKRMLIFHVIGLAMLTAAILYMGLIMSGISVLICPVVAVATLILNLLGNKKY